MYTDEKKKDKNYGSIFVYCVLCFVLIVEVARFAKPYYGNLHNLMETEALVVEEGFVDVMNSGKLPCPFKTSRSASARSHEKLSGLIRREDRARPPSSYCVKCQNFATMAKLVKDNGDKYESRPFSVGGYNWYVHISKLRSQAHIYMLALTYLPLFMCDILMH